MIIAFMDQMQTKNKKKKRVLEKRGEGKKECPPFLIHVTVIKASRKQRSRKKDAFRFVGYIHNKTH